MSVPNESTDELRERVAAWLRRFSCEDPPNVAGRDFIDLSLTWADEVVALFSNDSRMASLAHDEYVRLTNKAPEL